jgi:hypothetical protein
MLLRSVLRALALFALLAPSSRTRAQSDETKVGFGVGPTLWAEIGGSECVSESDVTECTSGLNSVFLGGNVAFDVDLLHWLRLGVSAGLGYAPSVTGTQSDFGERVEKRQWFVPLSLHSFWRVELGNRITLWGGPELGLGLYVDMRRKTFPGMPTEIERGTRSAFLAGVGVGLDIRLAGPLKLGLEIAEAVLLKPSAQYDKDLDLRAMTRFALVVRYL